MPGTNLMRRFSFQEKDSYKWWVIFTMSISSNMVALDLSVLTTCLPQLAKVFHTDSSVVGWLNIAYFIMAQSLMLTFSKLGDAKGRKKVFIMGLSFYTFALLVASLSQSVVQLIVARIIQGAAGATITALGIAITVATFPSEERGKALGILMGSQSIGLVVGPVLGGIVLDFLGWRAIFYARIPFMVACLLMTWLVIGEQKKAEGHSFRFDIVGSVTLFGWLSCLLLFLSFGNKWGLSTFPSILLATMTVLLFTLFLIIEKGSAEPIVELRIFKKRLFSAAVASSMASTVGSSSTVFLVPFYLIQGLGFSGTAVGIYMALLAVPSLILSPLSGKLSDKMGSRFLSTTGVIVVVAGLFCLMRLGAGATVLGIGIGIALVGSGMGIFHPPNNSALVGSLPKDMLGVASAIGMTARNIGSSIAFAISGAVYSSRESYHLARLQHDGFDFAVAKKMASVASFNDTLLVVMLIACVGIFTSLFRGSAEDVHQKS